LLLPLSTMVTELTEKIKSSLKDAAKKLTGFKKRAFMAQVTIDYFNSSPRRAETAERLKQNWDGLGRQ